MNLDKLCHLPMTHVETSLKRCASQFPELKEHILTSEELSRYIRWMILTYGNAHNTNISSEVLPGLLPGTEFASIAEKIMENPAAYFSGQTASLGDEMHKEDRYLLANHDISVGRMLRYMPAHWHANEFFEIYYAFSGTCPIYFQNEIIMLKPGTVLIIAPNIVHASPCYEDDCVLLYYMVRSSTFDKVFWNQLPPENLMTIFFRQALTMPQGTAYLQFETNDDPDIRHLLYRINEECSQNNPYSAQMQNALLCEFFILLLRKYEGTAKLPRTEDFYWKHEFSAIFSYIQSNYTNVGQKDVADKFHYSERQITRIIQSCTGMNFAKLVLKLKMEKAAVLLKQHTISIENIALLTGYSTVSSFYRAFTNYYACTPAEYRESKEN